MTYTSEHFKNCPFDPFDERIFYKHGKLSLIVPKFDDDDDTILSKLPQSKICRYIVALYDSKSPLIKGEQNLVRRKEVAAEIAGFDLNKNEEDLAILFECRDEKVVMYIQAYLRQFSKSMEWAMIQGFEQAFWEYQARLMQPIEKDGKEKDLISAVSLKTKLGVDIQDFYDKYQSALERFYGDDKLLIEAIGQITRFTPEGVAKLKRN